MNDQTNKVIVKYTPTEMLQHIAYSLQTQNKSELDAFIVKTFERYCKKINDYINHDYTPIEKLFNITNTLSKQTGTRVRNALKQFHKVDYLQQLAGMTTRDLLKTPNLGPISVNQIKKAWIRLGHKLKEDGYISWSNELSYEFVW